MENKNQMTDGREAEILFSRSVKAGQRIYYIDVKQNRKGEKYLSITESKKIVSGPQDMPQVSYEKHKIFLFHEDFGKFRDALSEAMDFAGEGQERQADRLDGEDSIRIDIDF